MPVPPLSLEERNTALAKAQEMRSKRMELRRKLKCGQIMLTEVFEDMDNEVVAKMRVKYLLESLPQIGKITAHKIMEEIGINETRRVQGLGIRQKTDLLNKLG